MHIFPQGIQLTDIEHQSLLHIVADPETWLRDTITEKARLRREALINEWRPKLFADPSVTKLPTDANALCKLIMARSDYQTRSQQDAALNPPVSVAKNNISRHEAVDRSGPTVTLFKRGIDVPDLDANCILAYVQYLDDWVIGALLGQVNRGKKMMIAQFEPIIRADPSAATVTASEAGLINEIVRRPDYYTRA